MTRRRIALVTHGFGHGGGVPTVARWLRDGLESEGGYRVDVHDLATSRRDPASRRILAPPTWRRDLDGGAVATCRHWGANAVEVEAMRYRPRRELTEALRGYDLIQVVAGAPAWAAPVLHCGPPVVLQVATVVLWEREAQLPAYGWLLRGWRRRMTQLTTRAETAALRGVHTVLVENQAMVDHVRALGQPAVRKLAPGVDTSTFRPPAAGWQRVGHLLTVCRLADPRKGLDRMVRAYRLLVDDDATVPGLVLAGHGALPGSVTRLITEFGLSDRITVRADVAPAELVSLYQRASVFLQSSYEEGLGLAVLEAMACGLPVVSTATHGAREVVLDGSTGWLVHGNAPDLPRAFADKVRAVLGGSGALLGRNGRERCTAEFSTDVCLRRFVEVHDLVLREGVRL